MTIITAILSTLALLIMLKNDYEWHKNAINSENTRMDEDINRNNEDTSRDK
jgi:hypothetical protein